MAIADALFAPTDREEALSSAYVAAVAAAAGYSIQTANIDRDGIDHQINAGGLMRPALGLQLKATINLGRPISGEFRFPLKIRNYDLLRMPTMIPRILIVLSLPQDENEWLQITPEQLIIRKCAYWTSLTGMPETENTTSVTVGLPENNRFDVESLKHLMAKARTGSLV